MTTTTADDRPAVDLEDRADAAAPGMELALWANRFENVVRAMANTLFRTSRSGIINTAHDFSCCIITADHEMLAAANSLPIHVLSGPDIISRYLVSVQPDLRRGDAYLHNSPYHGNSHAADHVILVPVVDEEGRHRFTVLAKAHQADCGNSIASTFHVEARDVYEEGALIFPAVQVQRDGEDIEDVLRMCELRIRVPEQWRGDYLALVGSARIGERRMQELAETAGGWDALEEYARQWLDYSEQRAAAAVRGLVSGSGRAVTRHDPYPGIPEDMEIVASVAVDAEGGWIDVDLTENADCLESGLNVTQSTVTSSALIGIWNTLNGAAPLNGGSFRRMRVHLREGSCIGIPVHPYSCSLATTNLATRAANVVGRAFAEISDTMGMADAGLIMPPSSGVISGRDPRRDGEPFVNMLMLAGTGGAGSPHGDGWLTMGDAGTAGMLRRDSVEIDEWMFPIVVHRQELLADSEGAGRRRGTPGTLVEFGPVGCDVLVQYSNDGSVYPPQGARGGGDGGAARQWTQRADGTIEQMLPVGSVLLAPGDIVVSARTGGGGFGDAREREVDRVARDVAEGWITSARAREVYGVAVDATGVVDEDSTALLRREAAPSGPIDEGGRP